VQRGPCNRLEQCEGDRMRVREDWQTRNNESGRLADPEEEEHKLPTEPLMARVTYRRQKL